MAFFDISDPFQALGGGGGESDVGQLLNRILDPLDLGGQRGQEAAEEAFASQERIAEQFITGAQALQTQLLEAGAPFRDIAEQQAMLRLEGQQQAFPLLLQDILREPGTSPLFQRGLEAGTRGIISNLAPFGLEESTVAGRAVGELGAGLSAQEIENIRRSRFQLAGLPTGAQSDIGFGEATALQGQIGGFGQNLMQGALIPFQQQQATTQSRQNLFGSILEGIFR
jgi:hypothetical protein